MNKLNLSTISLIDDSVPQSTHTPLSYLEICGDELYRMEHVGDHFYKRELVLDKPTLKECYKRWILEDEERADDNERVSEE